MPNGIEFKPLGLALATAEARVRDAMRSLVVNRWKTNIDIELLVGWMPEIVVKLNDDKIYVGHPSPQMIEVFYDTLPGNPTPQLAAATSRGTKTLDNPTSEELAAVMALANRGFFSDQPIVLRDLAPPLVTYINSSNYLTRFPNIIIDYQPVNETFILV